MNLSRLFLVVILKDLTKVDSFLISRTTQQSLPKSVYISSTFPSISMFPLSSKQQRRDLCKYTSLLKDTKLQNDGKLVNDNDNVIVASIAVGTITAALGFLYGKVLSASVHVIWKVLPSILSDNLGRFNPIYFITSICTLGGLLMGILTLKLPPAIFTVADFVSAFSSAPAEKLPSSRIHLVPLLLLSLVTSAFGFSVGPEAPMVCAGGLVGSSLARYWYERKKRNGNAQIHQETLAYAGAAGALTAFMGIPIAGSIFALELTRPNAGLSKTGDRALSPAIIASIAALVLIRLFLVPSEHIGGHFAYSPIMGDLPGRTMILTAIGSGICGALLGTVFHKTVTVLKSTLWKSSNTKKPWKRQLFIKTAIGLIVGILSSNYPQTLFWGEGSLQSMIDGQITPFSATKHGLSNLLTSAAKVNPSIPFANPSAPFQVGLVKFISIALACAGKFPGGIIFPLFFASAPIAHSIALSCTLPANVLPMLVICLMAATQASVTRTPLATALILSLTASSATALSVLLPACLISSYLGVYVS